MIEISGWCTIQKKRTKGIDAAQAEAWHDKMKESIEARGERYRGVITVVEINGADLHKFGIKVSSKTKEII